MNAQIIELVHQLIKLTLKSQRIKTKGQSFERVIMVDGVKFKPNDKINIRLALQEYIEVFIPNYPNEINQTLRAYV